MPDPQAEGPQRYRLKIFDDDYEVLRDRLFTVMLDLDGPGRTEVEPLLNARIRALASHARIAPSRLKQVRLEVHDFHDGGNKVMDWVATA